MKIATVVGARPQFIKAAALSRVLRPVHQEILIHTGQHFDANMSGVFFEELEIPEPEYNLGISGGGHGSMTGRMLEALEGVFLAERPDMVLVYGDTNSTLAGALAAVKLHIPVCHVEAGVRMHTLKNPEEVNRVLTDRISQMLFCCTAVAVEELAAEGITQSVFLVGDLMYDATLYYGAWLSPPRPGELLDFAGKPVDLPDEYYLLTCHREENSGSDEPLSEIFSAMNVLDAPAVYPVHPRCRARAEAIRKKNGFDNIVLVQPVGYLTSLYLVRHARKVVTDSGGLQREAWFYRVPCLTVLDKPIWPETHKGNHNQLVSPAKDDILAKLSIEPDPTDGSNPFGDGHAAEKIAGCIGAYERGQA